MRPQPCFLSLFVHLSVFQELMRQAPRQKRAELQRLNSISNLRNKQLSGHSFCKKSVAQDEPDRIEHYDLELRPTKLHELRLGEALSGGDRLVDMFLHFPIPSHSIQVSAPWSRSQWKSVHANTSPLLVSKVTELDRVKFWPFTNWLRQQHSDSLSSRFHNFH